MASEISRVESWIYSKLVADVGPGGLNTLVGGRIFAYLAPQAINGVPIAYPLVIYNLQSSRDVQGLGTDRVMTRPLYLIKVISKGPPTDTARGAADRIDEVIGKAVANLKDGYVFSGRREQSISYLEAETASGAATTDHFRHVGGLYRIESYPA